MGAWILDWVKRLFRVGHTGELKQINTALLASSAAWDATYGLVPAQADEAKLYQGDRERGKSSHPEFEQTGSSQR